MYRKPELKGVKFLKRPVPVRQKVQKILLLKKLMSPLEMLTIFYLGCEYLLMKPAKIGSVPKRSKITKIIIRTEKIRMY